MSLSQSLPQHKPLHFTELPQSLREFVEQAARQGTHLYTAEQSTLEYLLHMGFVAIEYFLALQGDGDLGPSIQTEDGTILHRSEQPQPRKLRTIFGEHTFNAYTYASGPNKKIALRPIDARLNLPEGKASYLFEEFSQYFCVEQAFGQAAGALETVLGQPLSVDTLERINRRLGAQAETFLETLEPPAKEEEGELLVVTADGKGVPLIREQPTQTPVHGPKPCRPHNRRMATVACAYSIDRYVRTPRAVHEALFREAPANSEPRVSERPQPCHKRMTAYFSELLDEGTEDELLVRSGIRAWGWLDNQVQTRSSAGQVLVRVCDGQESLWSDSDLCLELEGEERDAFKVADVLDIIHVCSYVWKLAGALYDVSSPAAEEFARDRLLRILQGEAKGVIAGTRRMVSQRGLVGSKRKEALGACKYLERNLDRMQYGEYLAKGYPIASGVIEGACRHLVKDRMERTGMRWKESHAGSMLCVRAVRASHLWEEFHRHRQEIERERLHPHRALLSEYTPTGDLAA